MATFTANDGRGYREFLDEIEEAIALQPLCPNVKSV